MNRRSSSVLNTTPKDGDTAFIEQTALALGPQRPPNRRKMAVTSDIITMTR